MLLLAIGCLLPNPFLDGTDYIEPLTCGGDVEAFCEHEFGQACPTADEAETWTCDGWRFTPSADGEPTDVHRGRDGCYDTRHYCQDDDGHYTAINFWGDGSIQSLDTVWPEEEECGGRTFWGDSIC